MNSDAYVVTSADNVQLDRELAGIGSRFVAGVLDVFIQIATVLIVMWSFGGAFSAMIGSFSGNLGLAFLALLLFAFVYLYSTLFEVVWNGQTPGKRLMGIQVVNDQGHPITWGQGFARSLVRLVDIVFSSGLVAIVAIFFNPTRKRLGDMLAGTLVIRCPEGRMRLRGSATWLVNVERGKNAQQALVLPKGVLSVQHLRLIETFLERRESLSKKQRDNPAYKLARQVQALWGESDPALIHQSGAEALLERTRDAAYAQNPTNPLGEDLVATKSASWIEFEDTTTKLLRKGTRALRQLTADDLKVLLDSHRSVVADLARARSMNADRRTLGGLNALALLGDRLINRYHKVGNSISIFRIFTRFPQVVREHLAAVALSALLLFVPGIISYTAIQIDPELGYELVSDSFRDFQPAKQDNMHDIPEITRPVAASSIITNNIQVTFLAFLGGLSAGITTVCLLIFNGIHIGAVGGWLHLQGAAPAFWGWVMPHGFTELLAIVLSGASGFIIADGILFPGHLSRKESLKRAAAPAMVIVVGVALMLVIAGLIEGFISPSSMGLTARVLFVTATALLWGCYFTKVGSSGR